MNETTNLVFFIDRCLGKKRVVEALRSTGAMAEAHDDHFNQNIPDVEWLTEVGQRKWVVLTKDEKIAYRTLEQVAVAQADVRLFVLVSSNLSGQAMGEAFVRALGGMEQFILNHPAPFIAKVYQSGEVRAWKNQNVLLSKLSDASD